jgi:hypothetical protein
MYDLFVTDHALWFTIPAIMGTTVFVVRVLLMLVGHAGFDLHHDMSFDGHGDLSDAHHGDSTAAFKLLSLQSIAAFMVGFGWGGLGVLKGTEWPEYLSIPMAILCGTAMVWFLGVLLKAVYGMQTSGNVIINDAVGSNATVYVSIPEEGKGLGQVQVVIDNRQRIYNAVAAGPAIDRHARVRVVGVNADNTLTVVPA